MTDAEIKTLLGNC